MPPGSTLSNTISHGDMPPMAAEYPAPQRPERPPVHPGEILREDFMPAHGLKVMPLARRLGISRQHLHRVLAEEAAVSPDVALRLGRLFGTGAKLWVNMQRDYDLWHAEAALSETLAKIEPVDAG